jgi:hypothetical protein
MGRALLPPHRSGWSPTGFRLVAAEAPSQRHENASGPHRVKRRNTRNEQMFRCFSIGHSARARVSVRRFYEHRAMPACVTVDVLLRSNRHVERVFNPSRKTPIGDTGSGEDHDASRRTRRAGSKARRLAVSFRGIEQRSTPQALNLWLTRSCRRSPGREDLASTVWPHSRYDLSVQINAFNP